MARNLSNLYTSADALCRNLRRTADYLSSALKDQGFIVISKGDGQGLPLVAFRLNPADNHHYDEVGKIREACLAYR